MCLVGEVHTRHLGRFLVQLRGSLRTVEWIDRLDLISPVSFARLTEARVALLNDLVLLVEQAQSSFEETVRTVLLAEHGNPLLVAEECLICKLRLILEKGQLGV